MSPVVSRIRHKCVDAIWIEKGDGSIYKTVIIVRDADGVHRYRLTLPLETGQLCSGTGADVEFVIEYDLVNGVARLATSCSPCSGGDQGGTEHINN